MENTKCPKNVPKMDSGVSGGVLGLIRENRDFSIFGPKISGSRLDGKGRWGRCKCCVEIDQMHSTTDPGGA